VAKMPEVTVDFYATLFSGIIARVAKCEDAIRHQDAEIDRLKGNSDADSTCHRWNASISDWLFFSFTSGEWRVMPTTWLHCPYCGGKLEVPDVS
jgi:hypothetical protein